MHTHHLHEICIEYLISIIINHCYTEDMMQFRCIKSTLEASCRASLKCGYSIDLSETWGTITFTTSKWVCEIVGWKCTEVKLTSQKCEYLYIHCEIDNFALAFSFHNKYFDLFSEEEHFLMNKSC